MLSSGDISRTLTFFLIVFTIVVFGEAVVKLPKGVYVPAVIVFGDSIVDTGNNNDLPSLIKANFSPYGKDFEGEKPTGRFCNGKVPADLIAEELGIKEFVPAYYSEEIQPNDLLTGVCFASGGAGFDPMTPKLVSVISLSQQLESFKEYIGKLKAIVGENKTKSILENSVYLLVAGSDDIANTYFTFSFRQLQYDVPAYTDLMSRSASSFLKDIYELGARRVAVFSAPPIGCLPSQRTLAGGIGRECATKYNDAAIMFNTKLSEEIDNLNMNLPNANMVYVDAYKPLQDLIEEPQKYGFEIFDKGCCGTGELEVSVLCNPLSSTCEDVSKYIFWDSYHPTEKAYRILVSQLLEKVTSKIL